MDKELKRKCRCKKCVAFRKHHPFEFLDIYSLWATIAEFLIPRLQAFKKHTYSNPANITMKEWHNTLDKIIVAFEIFLKDEIKKDNKTCEKGLKLFAEYYRDLWI